MPRPLFTSGRDPVPIVQEAGWAPGPEWTGAENLASIGIRSPHRPARSQSLYRLRYPTHAVCLVCTSICGVVVVKCSGIRVIPVTGSVSLAVPELYVLSTKIPEYHS